MGSSVFISALTILRSVTGKLATKRFSRYPDGKIGKSDYDREKWFSAEVVTIAGLEDLARVLTDLQKDNSAFVIRGGPLPTANRNRLTRRIHDRPDEPAPFRASDRAWIMVDVDGIEAPADIDATEDPDKAATYLIAQLPQEFKGVDCFWQWSSSQGFKGRKLSCHLWFWLDRPIADKDLKRWAKAYNAAVGRKVIDDAVFTPVQPHYIADPIFENGAVNPLRRRTGILSGNHRAVALVLPPPEERAAPRIAAQRQRDVQESSREYASTNKEYIPTGVGWKVHVDAIGTPAAGYRAPINAAVGSFFGTYGADADPGPVKASIRAAISQRPQDREIGQLARYASDAYLDPIILWVRQRESEKAAENNVGPDVPPHYPSVPVSREDGIRKLGEALDSWAAKATTQITARRELTRQRAGTHKRLESEIDDPAALMKDKAKSSRKIRRKIKAKFGTEALGPGARLQVKVAAGAGKSHQTAKHVAAMGAIAVVHVYQPTLAMAEQFAELVPNAVVVRGRLAPDMCKLPELVEAVARTGLPIQPNVCDDGKGRRCQFFDNCRYQKQRAELMHADAGIFVMSHEYLTSRPPVAAPNVVVVDESHWQKLVGCAEFGPSLLTGTLPGERVREALARRATLMARRTLSQIKAALVSGNPILEALRARGVNPSRLEKLDSYLQTVQRTEAVSTCPGGDPEVSIRALRDRKESEVWKLQRLVTALSREIDIDRPHANAVQVITKAVTVDGRRESQERIIVNYLKPLLIRDDVPVLLLDASADLEINRRIWGEGLAEISVDIERNAEIVQVRSKTYSRQSITGLGTDDQPVNATATADSERLRKEVAAFIGSLPGRVGLFCSKRVEALLKPMVPADVTSGHFGDLRGRNDFEKCDAAVVIGREQPSTGDVEALARSIFATDLVPISSTLQYLKERRGRRMQDGTVEQEKVDVHPDPRCQAILEQIREREIEQAIDRLRLIHNNESKRIYLLTDIVCDLTVRRTIRHANLMRADDRIEQLAAGGVVPLSHKELARCFPKLWPTAEKARWWLQGGQAKGCAISNRDTIWDHTPFPPRLRSIPWVAEGSALIVSYRRSGQRGSNSRALVRTGLPDLASAMESIVGPCDSWAKTIDQRQRTTSIVERDLSDPSILRTPSAISVELRIDVNLSLDGHKAAAFFSQLASIVAQDTFGTAGAQIR